MSSSAGNKETKLTFDLLVKGVAEVNTDIRQAEAAVLVVLVAALSFCGAGSALVIKAPADFGQHWTTVVALVSVAFCMVGIVSHHSRLRIQAARARLLWLLKLARQADERYVPELMATTSIAVFHVGEEEITILTPNVNVVLGFSRLLMYGLPIVLIIAAAWPHLQRWRG